MTETTTLETPKGTQSSTTTRGADGSSRSVTNYPDGRTRTTVSEAGSSIFDSKTTWTDAQGNTIDNPYSIDLGDLGLSSQ